MMLVRCQHYALLLGADKPNKARGPVVDDEHRLHLAAARVKLDAGDLPYAEVLRIQHVVFGVTAILGRGKAELAERQRPEREDCRHFRGIFAVDRNDARGRDLAARAVVLDYDPVAHDAGRGPVTLTGLQIRDDPRLVL